MFSTTDTTHLTIQSEFSCHPIMKLRIGGVIPLTTQDYPGKLACVVFVRGCPWRCVYCHNPHLQSRQSESYDTTWEEVRSFLTRRIGLLDAVVFSGGEPTVDRYLPEAIDEVRAMGFMVGLHTAGCYPDRLKNILDRVDWVGLDIKATPELYDDLTQVPGSAQSAFQSLENILAAQVPFECRTTISPQWLPEEKLFILAERLHEMGVENFILQPFRPFSEDGPVLGYQLPPSYPSQAFKEWCQKMFKCFDIR